MQQVHKFTGNQRMLRDTAGTVKAVVTVYSVLLL